MGEALAAVSTVLAVVVAVLEIMHRTEQRLMARIQDMEMRLTARLDKLADKAHSHP